VRDGYITGVVEKKAVGVTAAKNDKHNFDTEVDYKDYRK